MTVRVEFVFSIHSPLLRFSSFFFFIQMEKNPIVREYALAMRELFKASTLCAAVRVSTRKVKTTREYKKTPNNKRGKNPALHTSLALHPSSFHRTGPIHSASIT